MAGLAAGAHSLIASETGAAGNTGASAAVPVTIAPSVTSQNTWNTLLNFHVGNMMTVWDFNPAAGTINFADNLGQPGHTRLTLNNTLGTGATDFATFAGLSSSTAQLVTSTGTAGGLSYLAVTRVA